MEEATGFRFVNDEKSGTVATRGERTRMLYDLVNEFLGLFSEADSPASRAENSRLIDALSHTVNANLSKCYGQMARGSLSNLDGTFWLPVLETIRNDLRRIAGARSTHDAKQLNRAVANFRRKMNSEAAIKA